MPAGPGILTTAHLQFKDAPSRARAIAAFKAVIAFTQPNEPNVLQYALCLPLDDTAQTSIYMIEEYTDQAASDAHLATQPVQDLIKLFTEGDVLAGAPEVWNCPVEVRRQEKVLPAAEGTAVVLGSVGQAEGWRKVAESAVKQGSGDWGLFLVAQDEKGGVRTQFVLKDWVAYEEFQKSELGEQKKGSEVRVKVVAGYLGRESRSKL